MTTLQSPITSPLPLADVGTLDISITSTNEECLKLLAYTRPLSIAGLVRLDSGLQLQSARRASKRDEQDNEAESCVEDTKKKKEDDALVASSGEVEVSDSGAAGSRSGTDLSVAGIAAPLSADETARRVARLYQTHAAYELCDLLHRAAQRHGFATYQDPVSNCIIATARTLRARESMAQRCRGLLAPLLKSNPAAAATTLSLAEDHASENRAMLQQLIAVLSCHHDSERHCPHNMSVLSSENQADDVFGAAAATATRTVAMMATTSATAVDGVTGAQLPSSSDISYHQHQQQTQPYRLSADAFAQLLRAPHVTPNTSVRTHTTVSEEQNIKDAVAVQHVVPEGTGGKSALSLQQATPQRRLEHVLAAREKVKRGDEEGKTSATLLGEKLPSDISLDALNGLMEDAATRGNSPLDPPSFSAAASKEPPSLDFYSKERAGQSKQHGAGKRKDGKKEAGTRVLRHTPASRKDLLAETLTSASSSSSSSMMDAASSLTSSVVSSALSHSTATSCVNLSIADDEDEERLLEGATPAAAVAVGGGLLYKPIVSTRKNSPDGDPCLSQIDSNNTAATTTTTTMHHRGSSSGTTERKKIPNSSSKNNAAASGMTGGKQHEPKKEEDDEGGSEVDLSESSMVLSHSPFTRELHFTTGTLLAFSMATKTATSAGMGSTVEAMGGGVTAHGKEGNTIATDRDATAGPAAVPLLSDDVNPLTAGYSREHMFAMEQINGLHLQNERDRGTPEEQQHDADVAAALAATPLYALAHAMDLEDSKRGATCYQDPITGCLVLTSAFLRRFPHCYGEFCLHCPHGQVCRRAAAARLGNENGSSDYSSSSSENDSLWSDGGGVTEEKERGGVREATQIENGCTTAGQRFYYAGQWSVGAAGVILNADTLEDIMHLGLRKRDRVKRRSGGGGATSTVPPESSSDSESAVESLDFPVSSYDKFNYLEYAGL